MVRGQMNEFVATIVSAKPREKSGPTTGARYAFQSHVSLAKLLDLHETGDDYRAIFDYFDDLTILDASSTPTIAQFFQIKGKDAGAWTAASLCVPSGHTPQTLVGKMFHHTTIFGGAVKCATFLTNAPFKFELSDGLKSTPDHTNIPLTALGPKDSARIAKALDLDFPGPRSPDESEILVFARTWVPLNGYTQWIKGRLVDFLDETHSGLVVAIYRTLIEEISAKTHDTTECNSLVDLFLHKSLCRESVQSVFDSAAKREAILENWPVVDDELKGENRTYAERIRIKTATVDYLQARSKRAREVAALSSAIKQGATQVVGATQATGLLDLANAISQFVPVSVVASYPPSVVQAALLVGAFEVLNG